MDKGDTSLMTAAVEMNERLRRVVDTMGTLAANIMPQTFFEPLKWVDLDPRLAVLDDEMEAFQILSSDQPMIYCHKCRRTRQGQPVHGRYSSCPRCGTKVIAR